MSSSLLEAKRVALQKTLAALNVRPRRSAGQHFLLDQQVVADLLAGADVGLTDIVLEIGAGLGMVTEALAEQAGRVVAVELDRTLAGWLKKRFEANRRVAVVHYDILKLQLPDYVRDGQYKVVASLPFNVTSLILRNFLEHAPRPTVVSLLVQKEVAERVVARPGAMSLLSVSVQYFGVPDIVRLVPKELFWPEPKVDGAILHIEVKSLPPVSERQKFFHLARVGFSARRKMLYHNLAAGLRKDPAEVKAAVRAVGLDERCRAQEVSVEEWLDLAKKLL